MSRLSNTWKKREKKKLLLWMEKSMMGLNFFDLLNGNHDYRALVEGGDAMRATFSTLILLLRWNMKESQVWCLPIGRHISFLLWYKSAYGHHLPRQSNFHQDKISSGDCWADWIIFSCLISLWTSTKHVGFWKDETRIMVKQ